MSKEQYPLCLFLFGVLEGQFEVAVVLCFGVFVKVDFVKVKV